MLLTGCLVVSLNEPAGVGAHQNTLEFLPQVIASTFIVGLKFPYVAAGVCGTWTLARLLYTFGYSSGDPKKVCSLLLEKRPRSSEASPSTA